MSIVIPYPLEHTCDMCGCSCMAQLVGPLSDAEKANVSEAQKAFAHDGSMPPMLNPLMKGLKPDGSCLYFLNFPQKSCCFLDENLRCRIHAQFGAAHKPAACRRFPLIAIRAEDDIRIAIKPYCYANYHTCSLAPAPPDAYDAYMRSDEMRPILEDLVSSAAARPPIQSPNPRERAMACDQEREIIAWLGREKIPAAELFPALVSGNRQPQTKLPKPFLQDVSHAFAALAPTVDAIAQTLGTSEASPTPCAALFAQPPSTAKHPYGASHATHSTTPSSSAKRRASPSSPSALSHSHLAHSPRQPHSPPATPPSHPPPPTSSLHGCASWHNRNSSKPSSPRSKHSSHSRATADVATPRHALFAPAISLSLNTPVWLRYCPPAGAIRYAFALFRPTAGAQYALFAPAISLSLNTPVWLRYCPPSGGNTLRFRAISPHGGGSIRAFAPAISLSLNTPVWLRL